MCIFDNIIWEILINCIIPGLLKVFEILLTIDLPFSTSICGVCYFKGGWKKRFAPDFDFTIIVAGQVFVRFYVPELHEYMLHDG